MFVVVSSSAVRVRFERLKFHFSSTIPIDQFIVIRISLSFGLLGREHTTKKKNSFVKEREKRALAPRAF